MSGHRYFGMGKHLVCVDQSVLHAIRQLEFGYNRSNLGSIGLSRKMARRAITVVARSKLGLLQDDLVVELPARGEIGMRVHGGSKLFDLARQEVTKVFNPAADTQAAAREIDAARQVSGVAAAPKFVDADPGLAWYREEYICGTHATDETFRRGKDILDFYAEVEGCLLDLLATESSQLVEAESHYHSLANKSFVERWQAAGLAAENTNEVSAYLDRLHQWLSGDAHPEKLQLVPVHGDFSLVNAIATPQGLRFIDWEGIAPGCIYDDAFNFIFVERYYGRATDKFFVDMATFLERYGKAVRQHFPELAAATEVDLTFARRQYYFERLYLLLGRDASPNLCKVVRNSIEMFCEFDRDAGDSEI